MHLLTPLSFLPRCRHPPKVGAQGREAVTLGASRGHSIQIRDHPQPAGGRRNSIAFSLPSGHLAQPGTGPEFALTPRQQCFPLHPTLKPQEAPSRSAACAGQSGPSHRT